MKNVFRYPLVIGVLVIAILAEAYYLKDDLLQFNSKTLEELAPTTEPVIVEVSEAEVKEEISSEPVVEATPLPIAEDILYESQIVTGDPYVIDPAYADTYKEGIFDGLLYNNVDETYFDDAVFIGDSRIEGLYEYGGLDNADFYYLTGLSVYNIFKKNLKSSDGGKKTLEKALLDKQYKKVYIMLGVNELGTGTDEMYASHYKEIVDTIRRLEPEAIIYIHGIMWVTSNKSKSDKYINNSHINSRNLALQEIVDNENIYYLEVNSVYGDGQGNLKKDYSGDDVHLYAKYYYIWTDYLKSHAIAGR